MTQKVHSSLSKHLMSDCSGVCTLASSGELFGPPPTPASHPQRVWIYCQDHEPQVPLFTAHCLKVYREVGGSDGKESAHSVGDSGLIPGSGRSPEEGNGTPLQYSCLENSMERGAWWATVHGVIKSWTWLSNSYFHFHAENSIIRSEIQACLPPIQFFFHFSFLSMKRLS